MKKLIKFAFAVVAMAGVVFASSSCGKDDEVEQASSQVNGSETNQNQGGQTNQNQGEQTNSNDQNNGETSTDQTEESKVVDAELKVVELKDFLDKASQDKTYNITISDLADDNQETVKNLWGGHTNAANPEFWDATKKYDKLNVNFKIVGSEKLTVIEKSLFEYCNCALSIEIPEGITKIKENGFSRCKKLTKFTIPASVTSISNFAWSDCISIKEVTFLGKVEDLEHMLFDGIENLVVKVPAADVEYYKQSNVGGDHDSITIEAIAE